MKQNLKLCKPEVRLVQTRFCEVDTNSNESYVNVRLILALLSYLGLIAHLASEELPLYSVLTTSSSGSRKIRREK